jgi:hypothetical protein
MADVPGRQDEDDVLGDVGRMIADALQVPEIRIRSSAGSIVSGDCSM